MPFAQVIFYFFLFFLIIYIFFNSIKYCKNYVSFKKLKQNKKKKHLFYEKIYSKEFSI